MDTRRKMLSDAESIVDGEFTADDNRALAIEEYKRDTSDIRKEITSLSLSIIAAIWVLLDKQVITNKSLAKATIVSCIMAIACGLVSKMLRASHYQMIIEDPTITDDFRNTNKGKWNRRCSRAARWFISVAAVLFVILIF